MIDYCCPKCNLLLEDQLVKTDEMDTYKECPVCEYRMVRVTFYANKININGYSYENGYSKG